MSPSDEAVAMANQLAESLRSESGRAAFRLSVRLQQLAGAGGRATNAVPPRPAPVARVGIWERETRNGQEWFVRRKRHDLWADVAEIAPKTTMQRILLIGESVARGYFYEPVITPAIVLQAMLRAGAAGDDIEVIDLGHSSLQAQQLLQLTESAFVLDPDAIVIVAGNNWHPIDSLTPHDLGDLATIVRHGGPWREVARMLQRVAREKARSIVAALGRMSATRQIPMLLMVPEFNLVDWHSDAEDPPLLGDSDLAEWLRTRDAAVRALAERRTEDAACLAQALIDLDGGTAGRSFRLLAQAKSAAGPAVLRPLLEGARDAAMWSLRRDTPRSYGPIQDVLRQDAPRHGLTVVDVPQRFEEYLGALPGRQLFGDYCHYTLEGMRVAMAAAAESLLPLLGRPQASWRSLIPADLGVTDGLLAQGSFLAAVHNANWGNSLDVIRYHLESAMRRDPQVANLMRLFLESHLRSVPPHLSGAIEELLRTERRSLAPFFFRSTRREKDVNFRLVATMIDVLTPVRPAIADGVRRLMAAEHGVSATSRNLLNRAYSGLETEQALDDPDRYAYYRAWSRISRFRFVCDRLDDLQLLMTVRTPVRGSDTHIVVRVNDVAVHRVDVASHWRTLACTVPSHALVSGVNTLEMEWPEAGWAYAHRTASIVRAFDAGRPMESSPVFGELHALVVSPIATPYTGGPHHERSRAASLRT
jgi:hypothetical protein